MKAVWLCMFCLIAASATYAQNYQKKVRKAKGIEVVYQSSYKGKTRPGHLLMTVCADQVSLKNVWLKKPGKPKRRPARKTRPVTSSYIDYAARQSYRRAELPNGEIISAATPFEFGKGFTETGEGKHLGLNCKIVRTSINSNTIEVWYTNDIPFRGTPQANVGVPDGLVLRVIRNGDMIQEASAITPLKKEQQLLPDSWGESMDAADYQYTINQSVVITVPVFDQQSICFTGAKLPEKLEDGVQYSAGGGIHHPEKGETARLHKEPQHIRRNSAILGRRRIRPYLLHLHDSHRQGTILSGRHAQPQQRSGLPVGRNRLSRTGVDRKLQRAAGTDALLHRIRCAQVQPQQGERTELGGLRGVQDRNHSPGRETGRRSMGTPTSATGTPRDTACRCG